MRKISHADARGRGLAGRTFLRAGHRAPRRPVHSVQPGPGCAASAGDQNVSLRCHLDGVTGRRDTFNVMKPSVDHLRSSILTRRYNVVALAFVLCVWLVGAAVHLHFDDGDAAASDLSPCAYCMALANGAAPLPEYRVPEVVAPPAVVVVSFEEREHAQLTTSFYLSRGPPAI